MFTAKAVTPLVKRKALFNLDYYLKHILTMGNQLLALCWPPLPLLSRFSISWHSQAFLPGRLKAAGFFNETEGFTFFDPPCAVAGLVGFAGFAAFARGRAGLLAFMNAAGMSWFTLFGIVLPMACLRRRGWYNMNAPMQLNHKIPNNGRDG